MNLGVVLYQLAVVELFFSSSSGVLSQCFFGVVGQSEHLEKCESVALNVESQYLVMGCIKSLAKFN